MERPDLEAELQRVHSQGFAWAVRCCGGNRTDAEDVLHLAYVKVLEGRARFDGRSAFRTWLFGVIRLTAREQARGWWAQAERLGRWWRERSEEAADPIDPMPSDETGARLKAALKALSRRQSEVLHLVFYQDLTIQEAATVLGMPVGTARTHYERGKARLRVALRSAGAPDEAS
jgi:RNA polymerase sigma-70 factor (ECF subfamily)